MLVAIKFSVYNDSGKFKKKKCCGPLKTIRLTLFRCVGPRIANANEERGEANRCFDLPVFSLFKHQVITERQITWNVEHKGNI